MIINSCFAQSDSSLIDQFSNWEVDIVNDLKDSTLVVHCKSKDDDLGEHVIKAGDKYFWKFHENVLQTTLYWCNFSSKRGQASGQVFWPEKSHWLSDRCNRNTCIWVAKDDGISIRLGAFGLYELVYPWK
ncbi:S-protein homolog 74-like [Cucurbita moschata]|uniref:S-protein homolog n=1 Tax=Cucurbita moschata TaxID=3662 RepID=A0A6J1GSD6_CUCMO|nr:S-protein homolog 74-like [Cucurbita moschata]